MATQSPDTLPSATPVDADADGERRGAEQETTEDDGRQRAAARRFWQAVSGGDGAALPLSTAFDIVRNRRRRQVLAYVLEHDGGTTVSDLAEHVAALENDKPESLLTSQERKRVYIGLYQCHLPRMEQAGVIRYNRPRGDVDATPAARVLQPFVLADSPNPAANGPPATLPALAIGVAVLIGLSRFAVELPGHLEAAVIPILLGVVGGLALASHLEPDLDAIPFDDSPAPEAVRGRPDGRS